MDLSTPLTPLDPSVEMFTRGRPQSIVPVSATDAQRLSIVPEVDTPSSKASFLDVPRTMMPSSKRPLSEVTEIFSDKDEDTEIEDHFFRRNEDYGIEAGDHEMSDDELFEDENFDEESDDEGMESTTFPKRTYPNVLQSTRHSTPMLQMEEWRESSSSSSTWNEVQTPTSARRLPTLRTNIRESCEGPVGPHLFRASTASSAEYSRFSQALQMSPIHPDHFRSADMFYKNSMAIAKALDVIGSPATTIAEDAYTIPPLGWTWQSEDASTWTAQQVTIWMQESHIEDDIINAFAENDISGEILLTLEVADLKELGIVSFGKRRKVWNHICTLRDNHGRLSKRNTAMDDEQVNRNSHHSKHSQDSCDMPLVPGPRRRRKQSDLLNPIAPADSASIVAIEQLLPKPHWCPKGENCPKFRKQQKIMDQIRKEHNFPISPGNGGRIIISGDPGNAATAHNVVSREQYSHAAYDCRPVSEALPSVVGPSVVASSDLLGPGEFPALSLDADALERLVQRDPQDNVMNFLALQQIEPPMFIPPSIDEHLPPAHNTQPSLQPLATIDPRSAIKLLPKLQIPTNSHILPFHHPAGPTSAGPTMSAVEDYFSPNLGMAPQIARFATPASEMDVPDVRPVTEPVSRDTSQSVPPNMHLKDPVERSMSRPQDWRRPSMQMPPVQEEETVSQTIYSPAPMLRRQSAMSASSAPSDTVLSPIASSSNPFSHAAPSSKTSLDNPSSSTLSLGGKLYQNVTHSGWMKKRKTKLLRHEWHQHHFRLNGAQAQLTMHRNDLPTSSPLDTLNIDDYAVACSSLASNNKLTARFKSLRIQASTASMSKADGSKDTKDAAKDAAFSFQLVPTKSNNESESGGGRTVLRKAASTANASASTVNLGSNDGIGNTSNSSSSKKTHHFAVKTRDEQIDWMRELMLAKAQREKESSGHEVQIIRGHAHSGSSASAGVVAAAIDT